MQGYTNSINTIKNYSTGEKNKAKNSNLNTKKYAAEQITSNKQLRPEMFVRNTVSARGIIQNNTERERERETDRQTETETDRQTNTETQRQRQRETDLRE